MFHQLRTNRAVILRDAAEAALSGTGFVSRDYTIDVEDAGTTAPVIRVRLQLPWWRRRFFEPQHVEDRVRRMLEHLEPPALLPHRPVYDVKVTAVPRI
jgi:hypothetical protein